jgi:hypothetical protein
MELPDLARVPLVKYWYSTLPGGSANTACTAGLRSFKNLVTPANVPPVPVEHVHASTLPPVCCSKFRLFIINNYLLLLLLFIIYFNKKKLTSHISGPVVR